MLPCSVWNLLLLLTGAVATRSIDRKSIVQQYNIKLNQSNEYSPVQVGNGNFAFGADITGLQTFKPHNILSSWGWHNSSLPTKTNQTSVSDFTGVDWWTHGHSINYNQPNPTEKDISQWLIANPHRINLGRIGIGFGNRSLSEEDLEERSQIVDLWQGCISSRFTLSGKEVAVETVASPYTDTVAIKITSDFLSDGQIGVFFDFPYASGQNKFDAPFVGIWNATANHTTKLAKSEVGASILHTLDATSYMTHVSWEGKVNIVRRDNATHRYLLQPERYADTLSFTATFAPGSVPHVGSVDDIRGEAAAWWENYWTSGSFVSLPTASNSSAEELQRRIILSQYLLAVNEAGKDPPQESGLVNNGWYGKFHLEMVFWHLAHWTLWGRNKLLDRSIGIYQRFLPTSVQRAADQGYQGARLGKMSDPTGRSAPGEINSLLIWQQPHPMWFAEMEYRSDPSEDTLTKWDTVLTSVADFMASYAYYNETTKVYDLGPPMYPVSENSNPNQTVNPSFELAYWRFGLKVAEQWQQRQGKTIPTPWTNVRESLAPFPIQEDVYVLYEGVQDPWTNPELAEDHPGLLGLYGWLPPDSRLNLTTFQATVDKVYQSWNFTYSYGWDFPLLALTAARMGDSEKAVGWLLDPNFQFDVVGMPVGGARVATPYFPSAAGMLLAVGMMSGGWDGLDGPVWPKGWEVEVERFARAM